MGLFDKFFGKKEGKTLSSQEVIDRMLVLAEICMGDENYEQAVHTYKQIVELQGNTTAMYNLGSLYAQGKGVKQSFLEGAYWFHQANLNGDEHAGKLRLKCMVDYLHQNLEQKTPKMIYNDMIEYALRLYPREDSSKIAVDNIYNLAVHHLGKKEYTAAAKFLRTAAEYGNDGEAQNYLAVLYNAGAGVEKDDLVALYWFDRAVDNEVEAAKQDREGLLNAYKNNLSPEEFYDAMQQLSRKCAVGDSDIPKDAEKVAYWRSVAEGKNSDEVIDKT